MNKGKTFAKSTLAWLFDARCDGGANNFEIRVHEDFTEADAASAAEKYGKDVGRLPKVLRAGIGKATGIRILGIHKGSQSWFVSGWSGNIRIYTERRSSTYHEEVMVHEAAHVSLDPKVLSDPKWLAAQKADGAYISNYAKNYPQREDVAESFLAYLAARYLPSRISKSWETTILQTIPNRIAYFDALLSAGDMKPFTRASLRVAANNPVSLSVSGHGAAADGGSALTVEGGSALTVTAALGTANATGAALAIPVRARAAGTTATAADDYTLAGTISIPDGASNGTTAFAVVDDSGDEPGETVVVELGSPLPSGLAAGAADHVTIAIADDDATTVTLSTPDTTAAEGDADDTASIALTLNRGLVKGESLAAPLQFAGGALGTDFTLSAPSPLPAGVSVSGSTVTFAGPGTGQSAASVTLTLGALADAVEADRTVTVSIPSSSTGNAPKLTATGLGGGAAGARTGDGQIALEDSTSQAPLVVVTVDPALVAQVRGYAAETHQGQAHVDRWMRVLAAFGDDNGYTPMTAAEAQTHADRGWQRWVPVVDALAALEAVPVTLPAVTVSAGADVTEGGDAVFTFTADPAPAAELAVSVTVAASGEFGVTAGSRTVPISTTGSATLTLTTANDGADETDGSATVTVTDGEGYTAGDPASGTVAVRDDDEPAVSISAGASPVTEGGDAVFTVTASPAPAADLAVSVDIAADGAYGITAGKQTVTIPTTGSATLTLATTNDDTDESDGSVTATVTDGEGYTVSATAGAASVAIADDDPTPTPGVDAALVAEVAAKADGHSNPDAAARLRRVVKGMTGEDGGYTAQECRETATRHGVLSTWKPWCDEIARREAHAPPETVTPPVTVPAVSVSAGADVTEGGDAVFTVTASPAPAADLAVSVDIAADGAYGITAGKRTVTIPTAGSATLTLATTNDEVDEPDGSVTATVAAGEGYTVGAPASGSVSIQDDDEPPPVEPAVTIAAGASPVTEGGDATFTLTASPAPASPLTVSVTAAVDGAYGITAGKRTVTLPTAGSATLTLATTNDDTDEPDGSVTVTLNDGEGYTVGDPASGSVSIEDDDLPPPVVTVTASTAPVTEGGDAVFTVSASRAPDADLAVTLEVADAPDSDFVAGGDEGARTVTIPDGATSVVFTLATANDATDELDGVVTVTVKAGDGYTVGAPASDTLSIKDDDLPPPVVSIAAKAASVTEGGAATFTLTADRAPAADLTVTLAVSETGDHVAAADEGPATATIAKGATEAAFSVATVDDDVDEPDGSVTVTLKDGESYTVPSSPGNAATVTVSDNDAAAGPVLSVDDATGQENGRLPVMPFTVRLSAPARDAVRVYVSTRPSTPMSATPKVDYAPASYALTFRAGETEKQVWVMIHNDSHDEEPETFEVVLSKAQGAPIGDGVAVGTIVNDDPMPAAWLARFGRTVAEQALDGVAGRMSADRTPGMRGSIAGQALIFDPAANDNTAPAHAPDGAAVPGGTGALALADVAQAFGDRSGGLGTGGFGHDAAGFGSMSPGSVSGAGGAGLTQSQTMTARDALLGSSFSLTGAADGSGGSMAFWGRAAQARFDGREGTFSLDGEVTTGMLGADYARGKWLVGLAFAQSAGEGDYRDSGSAPRPDGQGCPDGVDGSPCSGAVRAGDGSVEASLTAAIPYVSLRASERLKLWGAAGYGSGEVTLKTATGGSYKADTNWSMAAAGLRGDLLAPPAEGSGPALAVTSDALWTRTSSEKTRDLAASDSDATRLRLGLEGSYRMALEGGGHLTPKLEIGARHDGGDAETGSGVELGGGIAWSDPALGLSLDVSGRTLLAHEDDDLKDRGYAAALGFDPSPGSERGPSFSLRQELGARAGGGLDALFAPAPLDERTDSEAASRWSLEAAYGVPAFGGRWTASPHVELGLSAGTRDYSLGWRWTPEANAPDLAFGVRAARRESDAQAPEHTVGFDITARW